MAVSALCYYFFPFISFRYKQHKTDFETIPPQRPISLPCQVRGCPCRAYLYVPLNGTQPIRCRCKHFADQHSAAPGFVCNACELHYDKHINRMLLSPYWMMCLCANFIQLQWHWTTGNNLVNTYSKSLWKNLVVHMLCSHRP